MNLYVNFVNNNRIKNGDFETAMKCFQNIIDGTKDHAFAYYYLSKCQTQLNINEKIYYENFNKFIEIIRNDKEWQDYSKYFHIIH